MPASPGVLPRCGQHLDGGVRLQTTRMATRRARSATAQAPVAGAGPRGRGVGGGHSSACRPRRTAAPCRHSGPHGPWSMKKVAQDRPVSNLELVIVIV